MYVIIVKGLFMNNIYIDVLITVNIFIDYFLLMLTKKIIGSNIKYFRVIIGSIVGGLFSLTALLPVLPFGLNILTDLAVAMLIIFITFGKCKIKTYIKRVLIFFALSFSFGGLMIFIYLAFKPKGMGIYNDVIYFDISPVLLIILTLVCYYILLLIKKVTKSVYKSDIHNIEIKINDKCYIFNAKLDTGCNVKEPFSGKSVIVAEKEVFNDFVPDKTKVRLIPFTSLGGSGILQGFCADNIIIDGKEADNSVYIGICENIFKDDIKAIIPSELINN